MEKIQDAFYLNSKPYGELEDTDKELIDKASKKLHEWEDVILSFNNTTLNIFTDHPQYRILIQSEFPEDLTGKMLLAYIHAKENVE